ncbi:hypothetical protein [Streptomyces sp. NPDC058579]|uniref:hypothetical protein n=1 Tax=Streptomyces sp. NPDC058579 TaxID=3346548 RepID=UPI00364E2F93
MSTVITQPQGDVRHASRSGAEAERDVMLNVDFEYDGHAPVQVVHASMSVPVRHVDLRSVPAAEETWDLASSWRDLTGQSFDVRSVDGNHCTMMRAPHIEGVATVLNDVLNAAPRGDGGHHHA